MRSPVGLPAWVSSVSVWVVVDVGQPRGSKRVGVQVVRVRARRHRQTSLRSSVEPSLAGAREDDGALRSALSRARVGPLVLTTLRAIPADGGRRESTGIDCRSDVERG